MWEITKEKCEKVQDLITKGSSENKALERVGVSFTTFRTWKTSKATSGQRKVTLVASRTADSVTLIVCRPTQVSDILKQLS